MELKMSEYQLPEKISFNFEELKAELTEKVHLYETIVYTEDQIKEAKEDRANLNKLKKALNDERLRREKEYMIPFNIFKDKVSELVKIIDKASLTVDSQVKAFEDRKKTEKLDSITVFFNDANKYEWLHFPQVFEDKWLNASVSIKSVQEAISFKLEQVGLDLATLATLPEFGFEASEVYKTSLDINRAISEAQRMSQIAKAKAEREAELARLAAEEEARKAEAVTVPINAPVTVDDVPEAPKTWVRFAALMTVEQARELKRFLDDRSIEFKAV